MIYLFWTLAAPTGVLSTIMILMSIAGKNLSSTTPIWLTLLTSLGVIAMLYWAYNLATSSARPGLACGIVALSWVLFAVVMIANGLARQSGWQ